MLIYQKSKFNDSYIIFMILFYNEYIIKWILSKV